MHKLKKGQLLLFILIVVSIFFLWTINTKLQFNKIDQEEKLLNLFNKGFLEVGNMFNETKEKIKNIKQN
ncbi:hypothetical protein ISS06_02850 [Patescibacteria group bacterium]|nr:hypothetical protein [Patescibacteria group bacterium]